MVLDLFAEAYELSRLAIDELRTNGPTLISATGAVRPNPAIGAYFAATGMLRELLLDMGLTPRTAKALDACPTTDDDDRGWRTIVPI
jgi:phage terminase small subunit